MGFRDAIDVIHSKEYRRAVEFFMVKRAVAAMSELAGTANHAENVVYAQKVLDGDVGVYTYKQAAAKNGDVLTALLAGTEYITFLETAVNECFSAFAGVST